MIFGKHARAASRSLLALGMGLALFAAPQAATAANPAAASAALAEQAQVDDAAVAAEAQASEASAPAAPIDRMKPTEGKGMPVAKGLGLQDQYSKLGGYGAWIHDAVLMPIITVISLFVLFLLIWVVARYNRRANPVASKTSHNTLIEVIWILVPVLILAGIAVPSIDLLAKQFKPAGADALTVKVTGNQWNWSYTYPDNGEFELVSNMLNLPNYPTINNGVRVVKTDPSDGPAQLEVDNRLVLPVGEPIRMQITASDVIHSFAVPSLWFKLDAVPGRINEKTLQIDEPGVYYGQCSELCGPKHGYMPIAIEALPRDEYNAWVLKQAGGVIDGQDEAGQAADDAAGAEADAPAEGEAAQTESQANDA